MTSPQWTRGVIPLILFEVCKTIQFAETTPHSFLLARKISSDTYWTTPVHRLSILEKNNTPTRVRWGSGGKISRLVNGRCHVNWGNIPSENWACSLSSCDIPSLNSWCDPLILFEVCKSIKFAETPSHSFLAGKISSDTYWTTLVHRLNILEKNNTSRQVRWGSGG